MLWVLPRGPKDAKSKIQKMNSRIKIPDRSSSTRFLKKQNHHANHCIIGCTISYRRQIPSSPHAHTHLGLRHPQLVSDYKKLDTIPDRHRLMEKPAPSILEDEYLVQLLIPRIYG